MNPFGRIVDCFYKLSKVLSRRNLYRLLDNHFSALQNSNSIKVLNIGAAGPVPARLRSYGDAIQLTNVDIDSSKNPDIICDACDMADVFSDDSFDCVVIMEVLEHIPEPYKAITEVHRILRSGGTIVISTPFVFPIHAAPMDFWRFTRYGLEYLLRDFEKLDIRERNFFSESIIVMLARLGVGHKGWRKIVGCFFILAASVFWPLALVIDIIMNDKRGTTGYFITAIKI